MKSSSEDTTFAGFVARALAALSHEVGWAYDLLTRKLGDLSVEIIVDGSCARVALDPKTARIGVASAVQGGAVGCTTSAATILDLVAGRSTFLDAALSEELLVVGAVDDIARLHDALEVFLHGAIRSRRCEDLLAEFRNRSQ